MKLASIETVKSIRPHPNADRLELATVLGWQTVIAKGSFKEGNKGVFVVIDTILPPAPWSAFLAHKSSPDLPIRLKTAKLRGEFSQGLLLPLSVLPPHMQDWQVGADVGGELGIKKYEKEIPSQLSGEVKCAFPTFLAAKTDEDNGLSNPDLVAEVLSYPVTVTMKLDGSSMTVIVKDGLSEHVCSRNLSLRESDTNAFWRAARKLTIPPDFTGTIQGELMGPGIQGNQLELTEPEIYVYQIRDGNEWLKPAGLQRFCRAIGAKWCPVLIDWVEKSTLTEIQAFADDLTLPGGMVAEGVVVRPFHTPTSGIGRPLGFKIINRNYGE